ncbi:HPr family phosphocarrier protein [Neobacillus cucumis]|uniref:HPr family phosphocarrier protein n=1 Tax=Neobacillus cucumis TaxID=1740721 RepID=UPI002E1F76B5|nr:HPr family phosphocarrier protein [Neobacillus cucumis]
MVEKRVVIHLQYGLQARYATEFVRIASSFNCDINLIKNEKSVAAKSIMGVMSLAVRKGEEVILITEGNDEQIAIETLASFLSGKE